ncbi:DUF1778 domain-containing protein, partial [Amaricoccus sp.]|uniref:type II toxin-antitoxin system TacA family antitoxin n=1 Tax=Amaricoccus sp. TaxID=1872485 RepID=UPI00262AB3F8
MAERRRGAREMMAFRITDADRRWIDHAAAASGATRTGFMLAAALEKADAVLFDRVHPAWDGEAMRAFRDILDDPPAP